jgi:type III pantothenate kinase
VIWKGDFMLLAIDVGNTNFTCGIFDGEELVTTFRMTTKEKRTSDEYGLMFCGLVENRGVKKEQITDVIIASVVPDVMHSLTNSILKYFDCKPMIVGAGTKTGLRIVTANPKELGADRVVDAVAGYELYGGPVLVIDYGTATTYDLVNAEGEFVSGVTSPGIAISANALWNEAAKLPKIEIKKPESILAKETITSMQAGLVYGTIGQTEYIVKKMIEESGYSDVKVVATGGLGRIIAEETDCIDEYDPMLTMKGLYLIYRRNKGQGK